MSLLSSFLKAPIKLVKGVFNEASGANAAKQGAAAQVDASNNAIAEQRRQYDQTRADYQPWMQAGTNALSQMQRFNSGDFSGFQASPDYEFTRREGQRGMEQSAAARGGAFSGNALRGLSEYNQGLASQQFGNYYNRLANLAGMGQTATGGVAQAGSNSTNAINNNLLYGGDARASGIVGAYNAKKGFVKDVMSFMGGQ